MEAFLRECIDSVLQQGYQKFELILVNDGSTDNSATICDEYNEKYPENIRVLHISNGGPLRARLIGTEAATGDVLVFLDADDCLREDALECIVEAFEEHKCDMVLYNAGESNEFSTLLVSHSLSEGSVFDFDYKFELYKNLINGKIINPICLKAVRNECAIFPKYIMQYDVRHGEDLLMSAYFMTNCDKVVYLNQGLYYYRDRPGSAIHSFSTRRKESIKFVHIELEKCIDEWNMSELKPLHNARKVRGWMDNLVLLIKNREEMPEVTFKRELIDLAKDPYFRSAYENMDKFGLTKYYRILSFLLYKKYYLIIRCFFDFLQVVKKIIFRRKYDG